MRIYAYIAAALLLASGMFYVGHLKHKADRTDAAEHALADYKGAIAAREAQEAKDRAGDAERRKTLADTLAATSATLDDLRAHIPKQAVRYVPVPGKATTAPDECHQLRLDPEFVQVWNDAADASAVPYPH